MSNDVFFLISAERGQQILDEIRNNTEYSLQTAMEVSLVAAKKDATVIQSRNELKAGTSFGIFEYSPMATRIRGNRQIPYAGEVYLTRWTWDGRKFVCETAWGTICEKVFRPGMLLVED